MPQPGLGMPEVLHTDSEFAARRRAEVYAFEHLLLPAPTFARAELQPDGEWLVWFDYGGFVTPEGEEVGIPANWSLLISVSPHGTCSGGGVPPETAHEPLRPGAITQDAAVLLARIFAERHGLTLTPTNVEAQCIADGGWVFAFRPGERIRGSSSEDARFQPFVVYVTASGECSLLDEPRKNDCE